MIVSASRRTDIPAFFPQWFMDRVREGWVYSVNPFRKSQGRYVSLAPSEVEMLVFWSKNPAPMVPYLHELDIQGFTYYFQYTLNDYPVCLEPGVPELQERLDTFRTLAERLGPLRVVWRYDPIVVSNVTPVDYHVERFTAIAEKLKGYCSRAMISLVDEYRKTGKAWSRLKSEWGLVPVDMLAQENRETLVEFVSALTSVAGSCGINVFSCCEAVDLTAAGIKPGACIDAILIYQLTGGRVKPVKDSSQRKGCLCAKAVDIGMYDSCRHGCVYCYACHS